MIKKALLSLAAVGALAVGFLAFNALTARRLPSAAAQDATYGPKVYKDQNGDRLMVVAGGTLDVSGGTLTLATGQVPSAALANSTAGLTRASGGNLTASASNVTATVALILGSKTKAQLQAYTPSGRGELWQCSDCTADGIVMSTGATISGLARTSALTTAFQ